MAQASTAWAETVGQMPPTYQLGDGSMIVTGDGNTSQTGPGVIDQSTVGRDRDVSRECASTTLADASLTGSTSGTTGATGAPLGFSVYPAQFECGG